MLDALGRLAYRCAYLAQLTYWFVVRPCEPSAHVAVWVGDRLLVVAPSYRGVVSLPAGGLARGETAREAACRELREEVGLQVESDALREVGTFANRAQFKVDEACVFELMLAAEPPITIDHREIRWARFVPPDRLERPPAAPLRDYLAVRARSQRITAP